MIQAAIKRTSTFLFRGWWQIVLAAGTIALLANLAQAQGYYPESGNVSPRGYSIDRFDDYPRSNSPGMPRGNSFRGGHESRFRNDLEDTFRGPAAGSRNWDRNRDRNFDRSFDQGPSPRGRYDLDGSLYGGSNLYGGSGLYGNTRNGGSGLYGVEPLVPGNRFDRYQDTPRYQDNYGPQLPSQPWDAPTDPRNNWDSPLYGTPSYGTPAYGAPVGPAPRQSPQPRFPQQQFQEAETYEQMQLRITRRYQNPGFQNLLNLPPQQCVGLYAEVLQMIDTRHLEPSPMSVRVQRGLNNLVLALENPLFVQMNQLSVAPQQLQGLRQALVQTAQAAPINNSQEAMQILNWAMQTGQQSGLRPSAVALEFVYGAVESLDKYSAFVPPERVQGASLQLESNVVGIGVQIAMQDQGALVERVVSSGPAARAGLQKQDVIVAVSGQRLSGMSVDQMVEVITGPVGSQAVLGVLRNGQGPFTVTVQRQQIAVHSVNDVQMLPNSRVGYVKLDKFTAQSTAELESALKSLHQQGMQALVLDLRGNPGGLLNVAVEISDKFLPEGVIVSTRGRNEADNTQEQAHRDQTWKVPLTVLIDHDSASASEIFAAAIQDNRRGVIVGRTSYGKGTVQTQFPLQTAGTSLRITTAKFYAPSGRVMAGAGVTPDVQLPQSSGSAAVNGVLDQDVIAAAEVAQRAITQTQPLLGGVFPNGR